MRLPFVYYLAGLPNLGRLIVCHCLKRLPNESLTYYVYYYYCYYYYCYYYYCYYYYCYYHYLLLLLLLLLLLAASVV